jgi:hypothetical protein
MTDAVQRLIRLSREQDDELRKMAFDARISVAELVRRIVSEKLTESDRSIVADVDAVKEDKKKK